MTTSSRVSIAAVLVIAVVCSLAGGEKVVWKPVENAVLKIDEEPAKHWEIYRAEKKAHLILLQLGGRFLMLDTKARAVFQLEPATLERKGKELRWEHTEKDTAEAQRKQRERRENNRNSRRKPDARAAARAAKLLPSAEWVVRSAGPARVVRVRLVEEGRVIEVQLPQQPDLRLFY